MSDLRVLALAAGVWGAALFPIGDSRWWLLPLGVLAIAAWKKRRSAMFVLVCMAAASVAAGASWAAIETTSARQFDGVAVLASDPQPTASGVRVAVDIEGQRYDVRAWGSGAGHLRHRLMGERIGMQVNLSPLDDAPTWLKAQGIAGRGTVISIRDFDVGQPHTRIANSVRRTIESGAASLSREERSLYTGLVYGDDREQSPLIGDNFEAAGLTHLLAVSGQNVAFVLAIVGPILRKLGHRQRFLFIVGVLLMFATLTRFEPSVVRASTMTGVAASASLVGAEIASRRVLGLAIAVLILADPLIVHSVAFQLSVAASAGILFWSARVARALPGPRPLIEALAVTATAQVAVAPLLVWRFDGLPVASLPANLLAAPAAGPIMMWGLTGGVVAGVVPSGFAALLHKPTELGLWWIDTVAATVPRLPLGRLGALHITLLVLVATAGLRQTRPIRRRAALALLVVVLLQPGVALSAAPPRSFAIDDHSTVWRHRDVTIVELGSRTQPEEVLGALRSRNVPSIDLIIVKRSSFAMASLIRWIREQRSAEQIWAPRATMGVGETVPHSDVSLEVGPAVLRVRSGEDELIVEARCALPVSCAQPPGEK